MLRVALFTIVVLVGFSACASTKLTNQDPALTPSPGDVHFDAERYESFSDYIEKTRQYLIDNKIFLTETNREKELLAALPFELLPEQTCNGNRSKGIALVHGLGDTPLMMRDIGTELAKRCFLVRAILLPGHGTRPGDLIGVSQRDWQQSVQFAVDTLKNDVDDIYIGGFSLGGLLAINHATKDEDVRGVIAFSPALHLPWMVSHTQWLKYLMTWADVDPGEDYARYYATPLNAAAQIYKVTELLEEQLESQPFEKPVFIAQSQDDPVINPNRNRSIFQRYLTHPASRLLIYQRNSNTDDHKNNDERISFANSFLPERRIYSYSHLALHISPQNSHYGENGDYRFCDDDLGAGAMALCKADKLPWRGEIYRLDNSADAKKVRVRLTYNPQFSELLTAVDEFLELSAH